jgi:CDP-glucose 4,6-dehydratase
MVINNKFWLGKNVLVTGHTGFKGSWLCLWLTKLGANVSGLSLVDPVSNPNLFSELIIDKLIKDHRGDIVNPLLCQSIIEKIKPEIIIHMAAQSIVRTSYVEPLITYNTNVVGTANILDAARFSDTIKIIIVITTDKCYENIEQNYAYVETDPLGGYDPYSSSKACAEHVSSTYYRSFFREKGIGIATARAGNVIGGGDWSADRLIPDVVTSWSRNKELNIRYPSSIRPWQHVLEPLRGYLTLAEYLWKNPDEYSGGWNFGPDQNNLKSVQDIVASAKKIWGHSAEYFISDENHLHESNLLLLNSDKARSQLNWAPTMSNNKALYNTINWYKKYYYSKKNMLDITMDQIADYEKNLVSNY